jgi:pyruvate-ferredoxin/flavodoxin oxidoreductase
LTGLSASQPSPAVAAADREAPIAVRHLARGDEHYASLPRFWDQVGVLYRTGETDTLTPDPYFATGTIPPLSSTFRDLSEVRTILPAFDPTLCTGCGKCWTTCPDSAVGAVAIRPASLVDTGIRLAGAEALRQVSSQLSSRIISQGKRQDDPPPTAGGMFEEASAWLSEKMALPEERKLAIEAGLAGLTDKIGALPVAVTDPFFHDAERAKKDGAEFLSVVVNPDSCKACGLCTAVCEPGALSAAEQNAERLDEARALWEIWAETPDTSSETIERVAQDPEIGPMAAVLLSRYCLLAMAGGDSAEPGSGEKIAVRLILAATEYQQQPVVHRFSQEVKQKAEEITGIMRETLAVSVPVEDLGALTKVLDRIRTPQVDLATLTGEMKDAIEGHSVDSRDLHRLIELAQGLTDLHWRLTEGEHSLGRARFGLAVAPGSAAAWAGAFPSNPFQAPVVIDMTGDTAQLAAGLLEGQLGETAKSIALLRKAELEIEKPVDADWKREALDRLSWRDLDDEERRICPPLILIGSDEVLGGRGFSQITWLLNSGLPIKILILADLDFGLAAEEVVDTSPAALNNPRGNLGLMALAQLDAYVAQTSIAEPQHLRQSIREAIRFHGPALIHVHAPSPERHGFAADRTLDQARLAVASRAFPLFRYDPDGEGVFGTRIDLDGNPAIEEEWSSDDSAAALTPAHWAMTEARFKGRFRPLTDDDPGPTDLDAWLELSQKTRKGKTPTLSIHGDEDETVRYCIDPDLATVADARKRIWRTLQELAGIVTPFTARLEQEIQERLAAEHEAELAAQKQASEAQISELQDSIQNEMAAKIRSRLLQLAGYQADQTPTVQSKQGE